MTASIGGVGVKKGCLIGVSVVLVLCLAACGLGYFVGLPRVRDSVRDGIRDAISTEVAVQIPATGGGSAAPGDYTITALELQNSLAANFNSSTVDDIIVRINQAGFEFGFKASGGQETTYSGLPSVENGKLVMTNMKASDGTIDWFFPAKDLGKAIEQAVNNYLAENNLQIADLTLNDGSITFETTTLK